MSLTSIKQKELKGKKNVLPKLRTILDNPYKQHSPVLPEDEVTEFRNILKEAISSSTHPLKAFATQTHIRLGLESSLRAINGRRFSCVFVSLSIRPSHIIRMIATSAAVKAPTAPIYAQPKLEELTYELFGVRALTLVLPLDLNCISPELAKWVNAHKKPQIQQQQPTYAKKKKTKKTPAQEPKNDSIEQQVTASAQQKEWTGDYISCLDGKVLRLDQGDVQSEARQLGEALSNMAMKAKTITKVTENQPKTQSIEALPITRMQVDSDEDEFLPATNIQAQLHISCIVNKYDKKSSNRTEDFDSDDEADEDFKDDRDSKVIKSKVNSLRADLLLKSGLGMARNKVELNFYESKIRVNGKKLQKKSVQLEVGDEIDVIRGFSQTNPSHLVIARVIILSAAEREDGLSVHLRRFKSLLIENYRGPNAFKSSEPVVH
ncbi:hypothetical protein ACLKA6_004176 [Drosophila palustris]